MANLTEISIGVRKTIKYLLIIFASLFVLRSIVVIGIAYWEATHRLPPPPPDLAFGKLPKPKFSENFQSSFGYNFILENIEGKPPETTAAARIFLMPKKTYTFESGEEAKNLAKKLDFGLPPKIDTVYYYYTRENEPNLTLFIDGTNLNFQYKYNYVEDPQIFSLGHISSLEDSIRNVSQYLSYANIWDESILKGKTTTQVLNYDGRMKKLVGASSVSTSQAIRVNFFKNDIYDMKILPDEFDQSFNYAIYTPTPGKSLNNIIEISYVFWPIDIATFATYPLISSEEAYKALNDGRATVVDKGFNENQIVIRKIYLAYFDSAAPQSYLQPIFVFEGDNGFVAYLPAVLPEFYQ